MALDGNNSPQVVIEVRPVDSDGFGVFAGGLLVKQHDSQAAALEHAQRLNRFSDEDSKPSFSKGCAS